MAPKHQPRPSGQMPGELANSNSSGDIPVTIWHELRRLKGEYPDVLLGKAVAITDKGIGGSLPDRWVGQTPNGRTIPSTPIN